MTGYILRRILALIPVLLGISFLVFLILHLAPGDPALIILGPKANATSLAQLRHDLGLDQPFFVQYFRWLGRVLQGDWGRSIQLKREVLPLVLQRFQATLFLTLSSVLLAVSFGIPAGIISATRQYSLWDRASMITVLLGFSMPVFWLGIILQIIFSVWLGILPVSGMQSPGQTGWPDMLRHLVLPAITLAVGAAVIIARMTRSSMLEVLQQDYIRAARAKGQSERKIIYQHALRNAFIPVITVVGLQVGFLLGGDILVEIVYSWPGIGLLMMNGIMARDFPLVQGAILLVATCYVVVNLVVDVLYAYMDPRIHYQ
jgi:ABC-type dipeptide/oligopeptide/nickel transport system permease component